MSQATEQQKGDIITSAGDLENFGEQKQAEQQGQEQQGKKGILLLAGGIGVVIILGLGVMFFIAQITGGGGSKNKPSTAQQTTSQNTQQTQTTQNQTARQTMQQQKTVQSTYQFLIDKVQTLVTQQLEATREDILNTVQQQINSAIAPILQDIDTLKSEISMLKAQVKSNKERIKEIETKINNIELKLKSLSKVNRNIITQSYPVLGTITVSDIGDNYITTPDGTNFWVGDSVELTTPDGKSKSFTIVSIKPDSRLMIVMDDFGNKYIVKLRESV
jgi:predicted RNase H-like nuclease (RuvC/YqgF family)